MAEAIRWRKNPHPDPDVVLILRQALEAAEKGHVRCAAVILINPMLESEAVTAGVTDDIRKTLLAGAILKAAVQLQQ